MESSPDRHALETTVNNAFLPLLEGPGRLPAGAQGGDDPPLGQPGAGTAG